MLKINETLPENLKLDAYYNGKESTINFDDYKGKWLVLIFYPKDFTFVCPTELEDAANLYEQFKAENAEILSVSCDTVQVHKAWHDTSPAIGKVNYPMLADPTGKLAKLFGTYIEEEGISLRGTFIIDPDGKLKAYELQDNDIGRSAQESLRKLQAAKFVREHGNTVCPANWKPGKETLKPGLDLVGKI